MTPEKVYAQQCATERFYVALCISVLRSPYIGDFNDMARLGIKRMAERSVDDKAQRAAREFCDNAKISYVKGSIR